MATGAELVAKGLQGNQSLRSLSLKANGIQDQGVVYLADSLRYNQVLTRLDLSQNEVTSEGVQHLAGVLNTTAVAQLLLSKNTLGDQSMILLGDSLVDN